MEFTLATLTYRNHKFLSRSSEEHEQLKIFQCRKVGFLIKLKAKFVSVHSYDFSCVQAMKNYIVVEFVDEQTIEIVPSTWYESVTRLCSWPSSKEVGTLVRQLAPPSTKWPTHKAACLYSTSELQKNVQFRNSFSSCLI